MRKLALSLKKRTWAWAWGIFLVPMVGWAQSDLTVGNWVFEAIRRKESGDLEGAIKVYLKVQGKEPSSFAAAYSLAELYAQTKQFPKALEQSTRANRLDRSNLWGWRLTKSLYEESRQVAKALDCADSLRVHGERDASFFHETSQWAAQSGFPDRAVHFLDHADALGGVNPERVAFRAQLLFSKNPQAAIQVLRDGLSAFPNHPELEGQLGTLLIQQGQWKEAEAVFLAALQRDPQDGRASFMLYELYRQTKQVEAAETQALRLLAAPNLGIDRKVQLVASILVPSSEEWNLKVDERWAQALLAAHPEEAKAWTLAADIANQNGNPQEAAVRWRKALSLPGGDLWPLHLGLLQADEDVNDADALIRDARNAQASYPLQALVYYYEGLGHQKKADFAASERAYRSGLRYAGNAPEVKSTLQLQLAEVLHRAGRGAESDALFDALLQQDSTNAVAWNNYAYFLAVRGERLPEAEAMAQRAVRLAGKGKEPVPYTLVDTLAWVLHKQGKKEAAWAAMEWCWSLGGSADPSVQKHRAQMEQPTP